MKRFFCFMAIMATERFEIVNRHVISQSLHFQNVLFCRSIEPGRNRSQNKNRTEDRFLVLSVICTYVACRSPLAM